MRVFRTSLAFQYVILCFSIALLFISGCAKKTDKHLMFSALSDIPPTTLPDASHTTDAQHEPLMPTEEHHAPPASKPEPAQPIMQPKADSMVSLTDPNEIDFEVQNQSGKTIFATCFSYQRKHYFGNWRWDKSPIYRIHNNQSTTIDIDTIPDAIDRKNVYGYLCIFPTQKEAEDATIELTPDFQKLDLDLLINLKGKKVTLNVERYGIKGDFFDFDFVERDETEKKTGRNIEFAIENKTGKTILVTCFVYQKKAKGSWIGATEEKDDMATWRYDKTSIIKIAPNELGTIKTDTIPTARDVSYLRGALAVFDESEEDLANKSTYELLDTKYKLNIGQLLPLANKKIIIDVEQYGILEDFFDFVVKPKSKIDFTNLKKK